MASKCGYPAIFCPPILLFWFRIFQKKPYVTFHRINDQDMYSNVFSLMSKTWKFIMFHSSQIKKIRNFFISFSWFRTPVSCLLSLYSTVPLVLLYWSDVYLYSTVSRTAVLTSYITYFLSTGVYFYAIVTLKSKNGSDLFCVVSEDAWRTFFV